MRIPVFFRNREVHPFGAQSFSGTGRALSCAGLLMLVFSVLAYADPALPVISNQTFVVTNAMYNGGAVGDGATDNTIAIQNAIIDASTNGGGTVLIPAVGTLSTYLCGPLTLSSQINLQIDAGATLKMLPLTSWTNTVAYPPQNQTYGNLLYAKNATDIEISGSGTIDGQGAAWWTAPSSVFNNRPYMIFFNGGCQRVYLHGVTLINPPKMHIVFKGSDSDITIEDITINTTADNAANTDGIDLIGNHCLVKHSTINSGDDNIAIGSSAGVSSDILITNCTFGVGHGVSIGSNTAGGVSNLTVMSCFFDGTDYGIRMKSSNYVGSIAQNLSYSDITMTNIIDGAIVIYSYYGSGGIYGTPTTVTPFGASTQKVGSVLYPIWRNVTISNMTASVLDGGVAGIVWGRMEQAVSNITFSGVNITASKPFQVYNARAVQFIDSQFNTPGTNTLSLFNADVVITNTAPSTNSITLDGLTKAGTNNAVTLFNAQASVINTNALGNGSAAGLGGTTLSFLQSAVSISNQFVIFDPSTICFTNGTNSILGQVGGTGPVTYGLSSNSTLRILGDCSGLSGGVIISNAGTLLAGNIGGLASSTGAVLVLQGTTLAGTGLIAGPVTVDGTLAPGNSPGTLTVSNNLAIGAPAVLKYELGTNSDLTAVVGNLTLSGTLNISNAGGFTNTSYTLFTYTGSLVGIPPTIGSVPDTNFLYRVDTNTAGVVKLVATIAPPVADFTASTSNGIAPLNITFTDTSTGPITNWFWDFGDGFNSNTSDNILQHTYTASGTYLVQLVVSGPGGVRTNLILVVVAPPCDFPLSATNADFGVTGGTGSVTVSPYTNACSWTATSNDAWIQITGGDLTTNGTAVVEYTVLSNIDSPSTRMGTLPIAEQTFTVTQDGDPVPPTVTLTAPTSGVVSNTIALTATASDNIGVVRVDFYRDGGSLVASVTSSPYSTNFNTAAASDGSHCFYARAFDAANNSAASSTNCVTVDNNPPSVPTGLDAESVSDSQIALSWHASTDPGTGVAGYKVYRDSMQIATTAGTNYPDNGLSGGTEHCYNVAAYDNVGHVSTLSSAACAQTFTNLESMLGKYHGLILPTNAPSPTSSGPITFILKNMGSFTAKAVLSGQRVRFRGQFDASGNWTNYVARSELNALQVILHLDLAGSDRITGTVSDGSFTSPLLANRDVYNNAHPCPVAGTFAVVLDPPTADDSSLPQGFGYGTLKVSKTGRGQMRGALADGSKINAAAPVSKHGTWPLFKSLYKKQGVLIGWTTFTSNTAVAATADWFRPALPSSLYPHGFTANVALTGKRYIRPSEGSPSVAGDYQITLGGGNLNSDLVEDAYLYDVGNVVVVSPNPENLQMRIDPATGHFKGSFKHPSLNKTVKFHGTLLQFGNTGAGYFLGATESGFVTFAPAP
ncbi:MAG TPA: glycosyl hydrolase family 28 protein [Verrucomicrobiae bacterium]|nr:glycosyl hydrolase family 28 protein [Verrucomicrobiae bacterium]